jgi:hypothetical protein
MQYRPYGVHYVLRVFFSNLSSIGATSQSKAWHHAGFESGTFVAGVALSTPALSRTYNRRICVWEVSEHSTAAAARAFNRVVYTLKG